MNPATERTRFYRRTVVDRLVKQLLILGREDAEERGLDPRFHSARKEERRQAIYQIKERLYKLTDCM